jgi:hypothetical protein
VNFAVGHKERAGVRSQKSEFRIQRFENENCALAIGGRKATDLSRVRLIPRRSEFWFLNSDS